MGSALGGSSGAEVAIAMGITVMAGFLIYKLAKS